MRGKGTGGRQKHGLGYVLIPEQLLEQMGTITDETLRVILFLHLAEQQAGEIGVSAEVGEIAEHCGLNMGRTELALSALSKLAWVESVAGTCRWRLSPPELVDG